MRTRFIALVSLVSPWFVAACADAPNPGPPSAGVGVGTEALGRARFNRHGKRFSPARRPPSVPGDYVLTRNGFMHPSCVVELDTDETLSHDGSILGPAGEVREVLAPCNYERYTAAGTPITQRSRASELQAANLPPHGYDGWIAFYGHDGSVPAGAVLKTEWVVPLAPTKKATQDIAFFNDFETQGSDTDILQPVLDWNSGVWSTESEHCCINGNDAYKGGGTVAEGDLIRGTVKGTNCTSNGACSTWTIITEDVTKGTSATLTVTNAEGAPIVTHPAVLETYDVTDCGHLPASGQTTFVNSITDGDGKAVAQSYQYGSARPGGYPSCGFAGKASGDNYTLIYGTNPISGTGGTTSTGGSGGTGSGGKSSGGATSSGGAKSSGGTTSTGGTSSGGATSTGGSKSSGGGGGFSTSGGATASGGAGGAAGTGQGSGGSPSSGGASTATGGSAQGGLGSSTGGSGTSTTGGATSSGGASTSGGATSGGTSAGGASSTTGGSATTAGGSVGLGGQSGSSTGGVSVGTSDPSGCGCRAAGSRERSTGFGHAALLILAAAALRWRRATMPRS